MVIPPDGTGSRPLTPEQEARRDAFIHRYQRFFGRAAVLSLLIAVVGVIVGVVALQGAVQAVVIAAVGGGGVWVASMCLVFRRRIRTGPKGNPPRWVADRF